MAPLVLPDQHVDQRLVARLCRSADQPPERTEVRVCALRPLQDLQDVGGTLLEEASLGWHGVRCWRSVAQRLPWLLLVGDAIVEHTRNAHIPVSFGRVGVQQNVLALEQTRAETLPLIRLDGATWSIVC